MPVIRVNLRDIEDHAVAIYLVFHTGVNGETYNIEGFNEWKKY